jgi:hypothetical protein
MERAHACLLEGVSEELSQSKQSKTAFSFNSPTRRSSFTDRSSWWSAMDNLQEEADGAIETALPN